MGPFWVLIAVVEVAAMDANLVRRAIEVLMSVTERCVNHFLPGCVAPGIIESCLTEGPAFNVLLRSPHSKGSTGDTGVTLCKCFLLRLLDDNSQTGRVSRTCSWQGNVRPNLRAISWRCARHLVFKHGHPS